MKTRILTLIFFLSLFISIGYTQDSTTSIKKEYFNEFSLSVGPSFPGEDMMATTGFAYQIDYKIMTDYFGMQISMYRLRNPMDEEKLKEVSGASSVSAGDWSSLCGTIKMFGRMKFIKKKLLIDLSLGFGAIKTQFPRQTYTYSSPSSGNISSVYSAYKNVSSFVFAMGVRANFKAAHNVLVFVSYDALLTEQNYLLKGWQGTETIERNSTIELYYSNILFGVSILF